jgi:hypothetical protein
MYQFFPPCDPFQYRAPTELTKAMTRRMPNNTRICTLVTFSTLDLLRGALVEFCQTVFKVSKEQTGEIKGSKTTKFGHGKVKDYFSSK